MSVPSIAPAEREWIAPYQTSPGPGVRTVSRCGLPSRGWPVASSRSRRSTLTGDSSAHSTGSVFSAALIASSKPAARRSSARRSFARATNPAETGTPSSAQMTIAARSTGMLPSEASSTAAACSCAP
jgi:hypothetical protein